MSITNLTLNDFQKEVLASDKTVIIDFYADWCGPCKMLSPIIDEIATENKDVKVCKVNVDNERELAMKFDVMSIPTVVFFKNGQQVSHFVGYKTKEEILSAIPK